MPTNFLNGSNLDRMADYLRLADDAATKADQKLSLAISGWYLGKGEATENLSVAIAMHGGSDSPPEVRPYTFDDIVAALNGVLPYDWKGFLEKRLTATEPEPPLDGLTRGGWKLVYTEKPTDYFKSAEARRRSVDLTYSIGVTLNRDGEFTGVQWDGPAFKAGLTVGGKLLAVNGIAYDADRLKEAITAAKTGGPLDLIIKNGDHFRTVRVDYRGGLRYPRLERDASVPARLDHILAPRE